MSETDTQKGHDDLVERTCIVTREQRDPADMIRFVAGPDGQVVPDLKRVLPGRGVWVSATRDHVQEAVAKSAFSRGLKMAAKADKDLPEMVEHLMEKAALGAFGFARKAGECITGGEKVEGSIRAGRALCVLHAIDGSEDGLRKISQAVFAVHRDGGPKIRIWRVFSGEQMNLALGATNVIHAALTPGGAAKNCLNHVVKLATYRNTEPS